MATITFLGGPETGDVGSVTWGNYRFELNKPTQCSDDHIIAKARGNRFFKVSDNGIAGSIPASQVLHAPPDDDDDDEDEDLSRLDAKGLLARQDLPFFQFRAQARRLLGGELPDKKEDMVAALEALAKEEPA